MIGYGPIATAPIAVGPEAAGSGSATLTADSGTFSLSGQNAGLGRGRFVVGNLGAFNLSGINAGLSQTRVVAAGTGAFTLTGIDAILDSTHQDTYSLAAELGAYTLAGQTVQFRYFHMNAETGVFSLSGSANLRSPRDARRWYLGLYDLQIRI